MADAPPKTGLLFAGHASPAFFEGRDGKGIGERKWGSGRRLEKDLMRHAAVLVFVTSPLANALMVAFTSALRSFLGPREVDVQIS